MAHLRLFSKFNFSVDSLKAVGRWVTYGKDLMMNLISRDKSYKGSKYIHLYYNLSVSKCLNFVEIHLEILTIKL